MTRLVRVLLGAILIIAAGTAGFSPSAWAESDFYGITVRTARGKPYPLGELKGKVVVIANTASRCGYTPQYRDLQDLQDKYGAKGLVVLGMPSNSFNQEDLTGENAAKYCELNHGVKFTILEKASVKGKDQHPLIRYLTTNAPTPGEIAWNFEKFVIDRQGRVVTRWPSKVSPAAPEFRSALEKLIAAGS